LKITIDVPQEKAATSDNTTPTAKLAIKFRNLSLFKNFCLMFLHP